MTNGEEDNRLDPFSMVEIPFSNSGNGFKMHAVVYPRNKNKFGGFEHGQAVYVVSVSPQKLRLR